MRINTMRARTQHPEARHRGLHWSVASAPGALAARELRRGTGPRLIARYAGVGQCWCPRLRPRNNLPLALRSSDPGILM